MSNRQLANSFVSVKIIYQEIKFNVPFTYNCKKKHYQ